MRQSHFYTKLFTLAVLVTRCVASCSASPEAPTDTCGPIDHITLCAPFLTPEETDLAERVWGAVIDCDDPEAIQVQIEGLKGNVGEAGIPEQVVYLDPSAWDQPLGVGPTLAHEIGHLRGFDHDPGPCDLMAGSAPSRACRVLSIDGCEYVP